MADRKDPRPFKLPHPCSPNARMYLIGNRTARGYNWRVFSSPYGATGASIPVIYCPWCGVDLDEWAKLQPQPKPKRASAKRVGALS